MPFHADEKWIRENYQSKLGKDSVLLLRAFDSRLTKDLHVDLQKLRCKTAFEALKFQPRIEEMASRLVERIGREGPYMALHLRLEKDVWVRTGCRTGLGRGADRKIDHERASNPRLLTSRSKLTARDRYVAGLCPLNANEISRMIKGLGTPKSTRIYWAGGEPFGGQKTALEPLRARFPNLHNKWSLTSAGELDGIRNKPSILAALDYIVCLKSKSFLASHGGNMASSLQDHRTYMGYGMPIKPNKKPLVHLFMKKSLHEDEIDREIKHIHTGYLNYTSNEDSISLGIRNCVCSTGSMPS
ncbi:Uncharacterized protein M6B38_228730 [Iris pallida]|uniref:O-fucosyltransferase family protein n=1 Tax=Iris pallida TaxID=29817 RepID=A0AAX6DT53_IRIPA|nr:Uncharacterized protein M6B38_228730 [Iris pallida]